MLPFRLLEEFLPWRLPISSSLDETPHYFLDRTPQHSLGRTPQQCNRASWFSQDPGDKGPAAVGGGEGSLGTPKTLPQKLRGEGLCSLPGQAGRLPRLAPTHLSGKNCSQYSISNDILLYS